MLIISNPFDGTETELKEQKVFKEVSQSGKHILLDSGVTIELLYDGRMLDVNSPDQYAPVYFSDADGSIGSLVGYVRLD